jgi:hypothetical protein
VREQKHPNFGYSKGDMFSEDSFFDISANTLMAICSKYLTPEDTDFIYLVLHGRRTKEISMLLDVAPSEVVRRRKILTRKIRVIYLYHYRYDYIKFLKFAATVLYPDQLQCLILHYSELMSLQKIANHMGIQPSTAKRWLMNAKTLLGQEMKDRPELRVFLNSFKDMTYLNIEEIKRSGADARKFRSVQVGKVTLQQWATQKLVLNSVGNFELVDSPT